MKITSFEVCLEILAMKCSAERQTDFVTTENLNKIKINLLLFSRLTSLVKSKQNNKLDL